MAILKENNFSSYKQLLGRIAEVFFGNENGEKVVKIKIQT